MALHLAVGMLNFSEHPGGNNGQTAELAVEARQQLYVTLAPLLGDAHQLSTSTPVNTSLSEEGQESELSPAEPVTPQQQAATGTGAQASGTDPIRYFERHEVDRSARITANLDAKDGPLEKALAEFDVDGSIVIECLISDRGLVDGLNVVNTSLPDAVVHIIVEQTKLARYVPARLNHKAVPSRILVELSIQKKSKAPPI